MVFLHPLLTALFVFLIFYSSVEMSRNNDNKSAIGVWIAGIAMIILGGLRKNVGADYPVYDGMYGQYFPYYVEYSQLIDKMLLKESKIEVEWLYVFLNKIIHDTGAPFYIFTLICSIITISGKLISFYKNSAYPVFSILFYFIPGYFIADCGHMRQALGMTVCLLSFKFIKERKVWWYLLCVYLAFGFHKSTIIFLPAYWLAIIPMNSNRIFYSIIVCVILSPFQVYNLFSSFLDSLAIQEVSDGFNGYKSYEIESSSAFKFMDLLMIFYAAMMIIYDKVACQKVLYYEYMRNIGVCGVCLYFIMRENPIFATRLIGVYITFTAIIIPNIFSVIPAQNTRRIVHFGYVLFVIFYYFVFGKYQGNAGNFTKDKYQNFLWSK